MKTMPDAVGFAGDLSESQTTSWGSTGASRVPKRVLVVEDEFFIRACVSEELRGAGYDVVEAFNADDAMIFLNSDATVDLIVSDVRMPGRLNGIDLLMTARDQWPRVPVIITSGHLDPAEAIAKGAARFIGKPFLAHDVVAAVKDELAKIMDTDTDTAIDRSLILIVDGDILSRHVIADYLRDCGYGVLEASNTDEALMALGEATIAIDVILCDVSALGSRSGFELATWVRTNRPELEVRLAGGTQVAAEAASELCENGPNLKRPYEPAAVVDYIKRLRASRSRA